MQLCLGDRAQDLLKSAPWEYKSRQLCQAWGAATALPEQAKAQQFLKQQPARGCYWTYPAPASGPWAAARLQVESCGGGKRETGELPDWQAGFAVLFKMLNQSFAWRGGSRGWLMVGRCLQERWGWPISEPGTQPRLAGFWCSEGSERHRQTRACWFLSCGPTNKGRLLWTNLQQFEEIMKFSIHPGC